MSDITNPVLAATQDLVYNQSIKNNLDKYGYAFVGVNDVDEENPEPAYVYTVGLLTAGMPELFLSGNMGQQTAMGIMNKVINMWRTDGKVRLGRIENFLQVGNKGMAIFLIEVDSVLALDIHTKEVGNFFPNMEHRLVQILWPDEKGYLPNQRKYTADPSHQQNRLLKKT